MLTGKFHSHITIEVENEEDAYRASALCKGKVTIINLERGDRHQRDCMITHHYLTGIHKLKDEIDVLNLLKNRANHLKENGFKILRIKLEHEPLHERGNPEEINESLSRIYTEIHIKCRVKPEKLEDLKQIAVNYNWHPSNNPFAKQNDGELIQFINKRFYNSQYIDSVKKEVDTVLFSIRDIAAVLETKYETAIYDSNEDLDRWWME